MKLILFALFNIMLGTNAALPHLKHFNGYRVVRVFSEDESQFRALSSLYDDGQLDFWSPPMKNGSADIMGSHLQAPELEEFLNSNKIPFEVMIEDVEAVVDEERRLRLSLKQSGMNWESYQSFETILEWLEEVKAGNPDLVTLIKMGESYEGRPLTLIKIAKPSTSPKKAFFIDATLHAREWITPSTATYIIRELVTNSSFGGLLDEVDFYILPVANPDGYVYSWKTHRLWRKTRSFRDSYLGCRGVDLNRNFGHHFGERGSSSMTCSEIYRGPAPFSEPESEAIRSFLEEYRIDGVKPNWRAYLSLHSYGQFLFAPWGYKGDYPKDYTDLLSVADESVKALTDVHGTWYRTGTAYNILYAASGNSVDYAKAVAGIKYSYTMELRGTFLFSFGFLLPARYIIPTAEETWVALQTMAKLI